MSGWIDPIPDRDSFSSPRISFQFLLHTFALSQFDRVNYFVNQLIWQRFDNDAA